MWALVELLEINVVVFESNYCTSIFIIVAVIWSWKYCDYCWEFILTTPFKHGKSFVDSLMCSYHRNQSIVTQKSMNELSTKIVRASPLTIRDGKCTKITIRIFDWISPQKITKESTFRYLVKSINFFNIM